MIVALAQSEIANFLETTRAQVDFLWFNESLQRSVFVDGRRNAELSHSSVFDVLAYFLRQEVIPEASDETVETWLAALDEFVEQECWKERPFAEMVFALMEIVMDFSVAPPDPDLLPRQAAMTLAAYFALLHFLEPDAAVA